MNFHTILQIGAYHSNHCEDFLLTENLSDRLKLIAVMDGCTMGEESVFASILFGKTLRKIAKEHYYLSRIRTFENTSLSCWVERVLQQLFQELRQLQNQLDLSVNELLSTLLIGIVDCTSSSAEFLVIGDGVIVVDGQLHEFEQNDKPDYLGYHLSEDFDHWFLSQNQRLSIDSFTDLSIATDGFFTFRSVRTQTLAPPKTILQMLAIDSPVSPSSNFFAKQLNRMKENLNLLVTDDLAIVRIINSNKK